MLTKKEQQDILGGKELNDKVLSAFQCLLKKKFPHIAGLQNTLLQQRNHNTKIPREDRQMLLQIIHIRETHWAAIKMVNNKEVLLYDSAYTTISMDTVDIITKLIHCMESAAIIHVMNVTKQAGMTDCAFFAMVTITCLALETDPLAVVHDQQELLSCLLNILVTGKVTESPTIKKRRIVSQMRRTEEFQVHCCCHMDMMEQK